jgi:hypothetical protein
MECDCFQISLTVPTTQFILTNADRHNPIAAYSQILTNHAIVSDDL